jgi:hypothetical protein
MDSTLMRYDQKHKVGRANQKKMLSRGGFTHLRERDNTQFRQFIQAKLEHTLRYKKHTFEMYSCVCHRQCMKMDF